MNLDPILKCKIFMMIYKLLFFDFLCTSVAVFVLFLKKAFKKGEAGAKTIHLYFKYTISQHVNNTKSYNQSV